MTAVISDTVLSDTTFSVYRAGTALAQLGSIEPVYASAYAENPYNEGPEDVAEFGTSWPARVSQPSFRLVVARRANHSVGFAFGHQLTTTTLWWRGMIDDVADALTTEWKGRTFAVIELAVDSTLRRHGIARELHSYLVAGLTEERVTLLVRPEATAARYSYLSWGYQRIGNLQPFSDGPVYDAMIKTLQH